MSHENPSPNLADRLERLELQIGRLTDLMAEQASTKKRRRRLFSIRLMLISVVGFAALFAWFSSLYQQSHRQATAVDQLIGESAFVLYTPRQSLLVGLLPGDSQQPPATLVNLLGDDFFRSVSNVSTGNTVSMARNKHEILKALDALPQLQRLRLTNLQLRTGDLSRLGAMRELQSLDLQHTGLDSGPMPWLRQTRMRWFNASHTCFSDLAIRDLAHCEDLQELRLERTCVTDAGLKHLYGMPNLRRIDLRRSPVSQAAVQALSSALPRCVIDWEPLQFRPDGSVDAVAARRGRVQYGQKMPKDPRISRRALAPLDNSPVSGVSSPTWTFRPAPSRIGRMTLDVF